MHQYDDLSRDELIALLREQESSHRSHGTHDEALRESDERFAGIVRSAMDAIISVDEEHRICLFNPAAECLFGLSQAEALGEPLARLIPENFRHAHAEHMQEFARVGATSRRMGALGDIRGLRSNGEEFPIEASISQITVGGAKLLTVILRDITERKRVEAAQREADRRKDAFLAMLGHELRNPLAAIVSGLEVQRLADLPEEVAAMHEMMARQAAHLARLVDDLLDVSRITRGTIALRRERLDLAAAVQEVVAAQRPQMREGGPRIAIRMPPEPLRVDADAVRLAQILTNLLRNAVKFTGEDGDIEIGLSREGNTALIALRDNGIGIAPEMLPRVFDLFARAEAGGTSGRDGLGVGLALTRALVELHSGVIDVRSDGLGRGSEFLVRLPLAVDAAEQAQASAPQIGLAPRRLLVVDDNRDVADSIRLVFDSLGIEVRVAYDGASALAICESWWPTDVLTDLSMPGIDGYELAQQLRRRLTGTRPRLIAMSGWGGEEHRTKAQVAGFDHYVIKPVNTQSLKAAIAR
jgi:PAS domain S-box-containing protein